MRTAASRSAGVTVTLHATWHGRHAARAHGPDRGRRHLRADRPRRARGRPTSRSTATSTSTSDVTIVAGVSTPGNDATLHRIQPHASLDGGPGLRPDPGSVGRGHTDVVNPDGHADLEFEVGEVDLDAGSAAVAGRPPDGRCPPAPMPTPARRGHLQHAGDNDAASIRADGDVLASWHAGLSSRGASPSRATSGSAIQDIDRRPVHDGRRTPERLPEPDVGDWGGDMAFDTARG